MKYWIISRMSRLIDELKQSICQIEFRGIYVNNYPHSVGWRHSVICPFYLHSSTRGGNGRASEGEADNVDIRGQRKNLKFHLNHFKIHSITLYYNLAYFGCDFYLYPNLYLCAVLFLCLLIAPSSLVLVPMITIFYPKTRQIFLLIDITLSFVSHVSQFACGSARGIGMEWDGRRPRESELILLSDTNAHKQQLTTWFHETGIGDWGQDGRHERWLFGSAEPLIGWRKEIPLCSHWTVEDESSKMEKIQIKFKLRLR